MNQSKQKRILTKRDVGACEWRSVHLFDCKGGKKMKLKWTIPYLLFGSTMFCGTGVSMTAPTATTVSRPSVFADDVRGVALSYRSIIPYDCIFERSVNEFYLDDKADSLCSAYMSNMLRAQAKLAPLMGKSGYSAAVRAELPGAPVGRHCVWGQHTQLSRALSEMGDTITVIPNGARTCCHQFKYLMREKYADTGAIREGVMFRSDSSYNVALNRYLARNRVTSETPDSVRRAVAAKFARNNFSADSLNAGTILIVPRHRGAQNLFHAIMYLGRGRVENGVFVPDTLGKHIYAGHNREKIGDLFGTYDTNNVFAADTRQIVRNAYAKELQQIEALSERDLRAFISDSTVNAQELTCCTRDQLLRIARDKYFKKQPLHTYSVASMLTAPAALDSFAVIRGGR